MTLDRGRRHALLSGVLVAACFPPLPTSMLVFVALVPLALALDSSGAAVPSGRPAPARAASQSFRATLVRYGLPFGLARQLLLLHWVPLVVGMESPALAVPFYLAVAGCFGMLDAVMVGAAAALRARVRLPIPIALAIAWTAMEWARAHMGGYSFPWLGLPVALSGSPELLGLAELVGERGATFWLVFGNGLAALAVSRFVRREGRRAWTLVAWVVAWLAGPMVWSVHRSVTLPTRPVATVAILQPAVPLSIRRDPTVAVDTMLARLRTLSRDLPEEVELAVAPEVAFPVQFDRDEALVERVAALAGRAPIVVGALGSDEEGRTYNAAFLVGPDGVRPGRWEKRRLVPGWERTPGLGGGLLDRGGISVGRGWHLFEAASARWGTLICFESLFGEVGRGLRRRGADALLALTNDAWFHARGAPGGTAASVQHPAHLVLRAIEGRVPVVRAANTGVSLTIDPVGRIRSRIEIARLGREVVEIRTGMESTLYVRTGDLVGTASIGLLALLLCGEGLRALSRRLRTPGPTAT